MKNWIGRASFALQGFYDWDAHQFYRDSHRLDSGAMSSNRGFLALAEALHHLEEEADPRHKPSGGSATRGMVDDMATSYYGALPEFRYLSHSGSSSNSYTRAHALLGLVAALGSGASEANAELGAVIHQRVGELATYLAEALIDNELALTEDEQAASPVVAFQVVRSIDAAALVWEPPSGLRGGSSRGARYMDDLARDEARRRRLRFDTIVDPESEREDVTARLRIQAREGLVRQLGLHSGRDPEFDPGSLLAAACILQRFGGRSGRQLIARGIEVLGECQDPDGSWRADLLAAERSRLVYVSSLEMATLVANMLIADLSSGSIEFLDPIVDVLTRCFAHLEAGYIDLGAGSHQARGWGNDRTRKAMTAEVWTTALALQLVLRLDRIGTMVQQQEVLAKFEVKGVGPSRYRWPDLRGVLPDPARTPEAIGKRVERSLGTASDPTDDRALTRSISDDVVRPILSARSERPQQIASLLLFGPPGTRKTSMVGKLAEALEWPLVVVSPPDFLLEGIEGLERRAQEIFEHLSRLRRAVIIFDECEELLRRRLPVESPESRTHGAFITAGMLPRLQKLRDESWCVFAIVTNTQLEELDPAVVRRGRLDRRHLVPHPGLSAQSSYLAERLESQRRQAALNNGGDPQDAELSTEERAILDQVLGDYEAKLAGSRQELAHDKVDADRVRAKGELKEYFSALGKLVAREGDLRQVTFGVLDEVVTETNSSGPIVAAQLEAVLKTAAEAD